jgi:hypothetical protein
MDTRSDVLTIGQIESRNVARLVGLNYVHTDPSKRTRWENRLAKTWGGGQHAEWEMGQPVCRGCRTEIDGTPTSHIVGGATITLPVSVCEDCMALAREHYGQTPTEQAGEVSMTPKWDELCPPRFKEAIDGKLPPTVDVQAFRRVVSWRPTDRKGIAMKGPSGSGKTTAFWALARELERERTAPVVLTAVELGRILSKAARDMEKMEWLGRCRVLMIDDLGKEKSTPAMAAGLWEVLDMRYGLGLPLILSTRYSGDELRGRFGEECLGDDITRRLNELCFGVKFALQAEEAA